jgi:hypothetical protein
MDDEKFDVETPPSILQIRLVLLCHATFRYAANKQAVKFRLWPIASVDAVQLHVG